MLGKEVKALAYEKEIDISDLEKGIYFLSLYDKEQLLGIRKIVKQ